MLMDISCPAELLRFEQTQFGDGSRQAYLTFLNEAEANITGVSGCLTLLDGDGRALERRRVFFDALDANIREKFTCHLALDEYPEFDTAQMTVEAVVFAQGEPWMLNPERLVDCTPPELADGPERVALVAIAGRDAVCYPARRRGHWVCVCGRFNRRRWHACRRCGRQRDEVLQSYTPELVVETYRSHVEAVRAGDARRLTEQAGEAHAKKVQALKRDRNRIKRNRVIALGICLVLIGALLFGLIRLFSRSGKDSENAAQPLPTPTLYVDYLTPVARQPSIPASASYPA